MAIILDPDYTITFIPDRVTKREDILTRIPDDSVDAQRLNGVNVVAFVGGRSAIGRGVRGREPVNFQASFLFNTLLYGRVILVNQRDELKALGEYTRPKRVVSDVFNHRLARIMDLAQQMNVLVAKKKI